MADSSQVGSRRGYARTIAAVQEAGTPVTIATGRIFDFVRAVAPDFGRFPASDNRSGRGDR